MVHGCRIVNSEFGKCTCKYCLESMGLHKGTLEKHQASKKHVMKVGLEEVEAQLKPANLKKNQVPMDAFLPGGSFYVPPQRAGDKEKRGLLACKFLSEGLSPFMVSKILTDNVCRIIRSIPDQFGKKTMEECLEGGISSMKALITAKLRDQKVCLITDEATKKYNLSCSALAILASVPTLKSPVLLKCVPSLSHYHATSITEALGKALEEYGIDGKNVIALCSDNAATMSAVAKKMEVPRFGCLCHSLNLVLGALGAVLVPDVSSLFKEIKRFFTVGVSNRSKVLREANLSFNKLRPTLTRWGSMSHAVEYLLDHWQELQNVVAKTGKTTRMKESLLKALGSVGLEVRCRIYAFFSEQLVKLILAAEGNAPDSSLANQLLHFREFLEHMLVSENAKNVIGDALPRCNQRCIELRSLMGEQMQSPEQVELVKTAVTNALEKWKDRVDVMTMLLRSRVCLNPQSSVKGDLPRDVIPWRMTPEILSQYVSFTNRPLPCDSDTATTGPQDFWCNASPDFAELAEYARAIFAITLSSTSAERAFSLMRNIEVPNRCRLGDQAFANEMFCSYNKDVLEGLIAGAAAASSTTTTPPILKDVSTSKTKP
jgi:hypothetical protein